MPGIEASVVNVKNLQGKEEEVNGLARTDGEEKSQLLKEAKDRPNRILRYAEVYVKHVARRVDSILTQCLF